MRTLTARERYLRLFKGEPIDRIPVCPRVYENVVFEYFDSKDIDYYQSIAEYYRHFHFDAIDWNCMALPHLHFELTDFSVEGPNWRPTITHEHAYGTEYEICTVETPAGTVQRVLSISTISKFEVERAITDMPVKTEKDFDIIAEFMPESQVDTCNIRRMKELLSDEGIISPSCHGPFNILGYCYRKLDDLYMDPLCRPEFYHRMMEYFTERICKVLKVWLDEGVEMVDVGTNMAGGDVISPEMLVRDMLPYENRIADFIQQRGAVALYHNCGMAKNHLDVYDKLHHRIWGYVAPPPHGDSVLEEVIQKVPEELILWGHVDQIDFLRKASPREIEERVKYCCETMKSRGNYILGTSDYLEINTPPENLHAFVEAGHKYGSYED